MDTRIPALPKSRLRRLVPTMAKLCVALDMGVDFRIRDDLIEPTSPLMQATVSTDAEEPKV